MNKRELAEALSIRTGLAPSILEAVLSETINSINESLVKGDVVDLEHFGKFHVAGGSTPDGAILTFEPSDELRSSLQQGFSRVSETLVFRGGQVVNDRPVIPLKPPTDEIPEPVPIDKAGGRPVDLTLKDDTPPYAPPPKIERGTVVMRQREADRQAEAAELQGTNEEDVGEAKTVIMPKGSSSASMKATPAPDEVLRVPVSSKAPQSADQPAESGSASADEITKAASTEELTVAEAAAELEQMFATDGANPPPKVEYYQSEDDSDDADEEPSSGDDQVTTLSNFAADILGLEGADLERGLGLGGTGSPIAHGRRLTFPGQISPQAKEQGQRRWRPADGDERRSFKELTLRNFFLSLGSVVRDKTSHEPLIVFDVVDEHGPEGERYMPKVLRVSGMQAPIFASDGAPASGRAHQLRFEEETFDWSKHEVLMVIDEAQGPRTHSFDIGTLRDNKRFDRARVVLATEYEAFLSESKKKKKKK